MKPLPLMLALLMAGALPTFAQVNVITQHNDLARTGQNLSETVLTPSNVNDSHFGLLHNIALDDQPYASPLIYTGLTIGGVVHNVVYMATANNSVYALDATTGAQLWHVNFGTAPTNGDGSSGDCNDEPGSFGIVATPVISPTNSCIYVVSMTKGEYGDGSGVLNWRLHKLDLATGNEDSGSPVLITGTNFTPGFENQRPALLNTNSKIYVCFGSHCDTTPSNGRIFAFDAGTLAKDDEFDLTVPGGSASLASVWQSGQGPAADSSGNVYFITGNGTWDGVSNFGESFMKMSPTLGLESYFTANDYASLNGGDTDLGAGGVLIMPGSGDLVGGGKSGKLYVLNPSSLGGLSANDANAIQVFQAVPNTGGFEDFIHGSPAYFANSTGPAIYIWGAADHGRCYQFVNGKFNTTPSSITTVTLPESNIDTTGEAGGNFSISANGTTNGIAWAYGVLSGNANNQTSPGVLLAFDANNLATQLWSSQDIPSRDSLGNLAKYSYPVIANGLVYISDWGSQLTKTGGLCIYGPLSGGGGGTGTTVSLSSSFNIAGIYTDGTAFSGGLDGHGNAYSATLLGTSQTWSGTNFVIGPANVNNAVTGTGQAISLPAGSFTTLKMLATSVNSSQPSQTFTVTYTDNSTSTFTQGLSDWGSSQSYAGESVAVSMAYRNVSSGRQTQTFDLYGYSFTLNSAKTVKSITLPNNADVKVVAITLTGTTTEINFDVPGGVSGFTNFSGQGAAADAGNNFWNAIVTNGTTSSCKLDNGSTTSPITLTVSSDSVYSSGGQGTQGMPSGLQSPFYDSKPGPKTCTLANVPAGTYNLYLYGINGDNGDCDRGTTFTVGSSSLSTVNTTAAYNTFIQGNDYVVFTNIVVGSGGGSIVFTYKANTSVLVGGVANAIGNFNGLQLIEQ